MPMGPTTEHIFHISLSRACTNSVVSDYAVINVTQEENVIPAKCLSEFLSMQCFPTTDVLVTASDWLKLGYFGCSTTFESTNHRIRGNVGVGGDL